MKFRAISLFSLLSLFMVSVNAEEQSLTASFVDSAWNGEQVPMGQECEKFGGEGVTPTLKIENIPVDANAIVMAYSDRSYQPMDHGGHGQFGYRFDTSTTTVTIPSLAGHTFEMPDNYYLIEAQRAPKWDKAGAYLPPCSGGMGNEYYVTIRAVKVVDGGIREVLGSTELNLGKY